MTPRAEHPIRHRRRVGRRRALIGALTAVGVTGAAVAVGGLLSSAGAASAWPEAKGSKPYQRPSRSRPLTTAASSGSTARANFGSGGQGGPGPALRAQGRAVLKNVILGSPAADGIHCLGSCTLENVWWEDVGEDAATFKGTSANSTYTVRGGGARKASDKVFQFNGTGKLVVTKFQVSEFGKLVRSCGNCKKQHKRTVVIDDVDITAPGKSIVGVNANFGDTASLREVRVHGDTKKKIKPCIRFTGNNTGKQPTEIGTGPDGVTCRYKDSDLSYD